MGVPSIALSRGDSTSKYEQSIHVSCDTFLFAVFQGLHTAVASKIAYAEVNRPHRYVEDRHAFDELEPPTELATNTSIPMAAFESEDPHSAHMRRSARETKPR